MGLKRLLDQLYSKKYLLLTNTLTGVGFFTAGDLLVQEIIEKRDWKREGIDWKRLREFFLLIFFSLVNFYEILLFFILIFLIETSACAGAYMGFVFHYWYKFLDFKFPGRAPNVIKKKLTAELLIGPPFAVSMFWLMGKMENKSDKKIFKNIRQNIVYLLMVQFRQ